jgi:3-oxoacyl-[acyl-carrier-protein] synthase-1
MENQVASMKTVWVVGDNMISPLGETTVANYQNVRAGNSGITKIELTESPFYASYIANLQATTTNTRFENLVLQAAQPIVKQTTLPPDKTLFILSTTKGNIELLKSEPNIGLHPRLALHAIASHVAQQLGLKNSLVVSNACISGVLALIIAKRLLQNGEYDRALVVGADVLSPFIVSGFQCLQAMSSEPCKPFDKDRSGINLGEGAGALLLTTTPESFQTSYKIKLTGFGLSNDANHISGPSRTGEELASAIAQAFTQAFTQAKLTAKQVDVISGHGTATLFNDEMEAKALTLAGLNQTPLTGLKGYFGHTLGAAGVIETIMAMQGMLQNETVDTKGYTAHGVSVPLNITQGVKSQSQKRILKTASGFGGCNAALILEQE